VVAKQSPAARLLRTTLRPERGRLTRVLGVLFTAMGLRLLTPWLLGSFVDAARTGRPLRALTNIAAAYVAAALVAEALQLLVVRGSVGIAWRAGNRLRERLAARALRLDLAWHGRHSPGQLIERIDGDVDALVRFFANAVVSFAGNGVLVLGMLAISFTVDWRVGLLLLGSAAAGGVLMVRLRIKAIDAREAEREANAILYGDLEERLGGLEDLRANGAGEYAVHRLHQNSARSWRAARHASLRGDGAYAAAAMAFGAGSTATLALTIWLYTRGSISLGAVLALFRYSQMLGEPLQNIAEQLKELHKALAGSRRAALLLATEPGVADGPLGPDALPPGALSVEVDGVTFGYAPDAPPALRDVHLRLAPGTHLGVVGRTGSGKTTFGRLLLRFYDVDAGAVRVGGVDVRDLATSALRDRVAVVTQDVELFRASVRDNLTVLGARPATDDELRGVLSRVGLDDWLAALPDGLDTELGTGGRASAGEAQLIAFARALRVDPDLVVLDEASSRLDPATERRVRAATGDLLAGRTAVVVAHQLSTLDRVDEIAVLERGVVVEHGRRDELAARPDSAFAGLLRVAHDGLLPDEVVL
jgi:ABC-type multidrug transport system fused ATPase/permease subunit